MRVHLSAIDGQTLLPTLSVLICKYEAFQIHAHARDIKRLKDKTVKAVCKTLMNLIALYANGNR